MKTTIDLPDSLLRDAQAVARAEGRTVRSLMEDGLRAILERYRQSGAFSLPDASVDGDGLQPEFRGASWEDLRAAAYGDRL